MRLMRARRAMLLVTLFATAATFTSTPAVIADVGTSTAWRDGRFFVDVPNVVRRSNIVLGRANVQPSESLPLGNGRLGVAAWAANGFTARLNRVDTFPDRKSPGRVVIPALSRLTTAPDFSAYLDLYDAVLVETGGGMTAKIYVRSDADELFVDVSGADPTVVQEARVGLWDGRQPSAQAYGTSGLLTESWRDDTAPGASGQWFGSIAALTAGGRDVMVSAIDSRTIEAKFRPWPDGSFRVIVAAPAWTEQDPASELLPGLDADVRLDSALIGSEHADWWHDFWNRIGLIRLSSADGVADYIENLRTINLYATAAESRGDLPGSNGGVADLFSFSSNDDHDWYPAGFWIWNLRMQQAANTSAGAFDLNAPLYSLYRRNLVKLNTWTARHMPGYDGICIPETMRFNGNGYYTGTIARSNASCDATVPPEWNSLTVTSGAEVALWIWQEYLMTDDARVLSNNYPILSGAARLLLSRAKLGNDGMLHSFSNAHETQWDVKDPVTDVAAMRALFPVVIQAATTLHIDADLVAKLQDALAKLPPLPLTDAVTRTRLLGPDASATDDSIIALSAEPAATRHNEENLGLEPVWPYSLIGDDSPLTDLARRTYQHRASVHEPDWSFDALQAARLGLGDEVRKALVATTETYQLYPSGLASWKTKVGQEPYIEQSGVVAAAVAEAITQDYDGLLRIAPALPPGWDVDATVFVQHRTRVHVQVRGGVPVTVAVESGADHEMRVRNPWPGQSVRVLDENGNIVVGNTTEATLSFSARRGSSYTIEQVGARLADLPLAVVTGTPASAAKHLGPVQIGLDPAR